MTVEGPYFINIWVPVSELAVFGSVQHYKSEENVFHLLRCKMYEQNMPKKSIFLSLKLDTIPDYPDLNVIM